MIVDRKKEKEILYAAYGYIAEGIKATYEWTCYVDKPEEDCLTSVIIKNADGKEVYKQTVFDYPIFAKCFNENIDNFLWWIEHDSPDSCILEKTFDDVFLDNNYFFSHKIMQRKEQEKREEEARQIILKREAMEKAIVSHCKEKELKLYRTYSQLYIMEFYDSKVEELFNKSSNEQLEDYIRFVTENSTNEAKLIYHADLYNEDIKEVYEAIMKL